MFVIIGLGSVLITSTFSYYYTKKAILNRAFEQLTSVREMKKLRIVNFFSDRINELNHIANSSATLVFFSFRKQQNANIQHLNDLSDMLKNSPYFKNLLLGDFTGCVIVNEDTAMSLNDKDAIESFIPLVTLKEIENKVKELQQPFIQDFKVDKGGKHGDKLYGVAPVFADNDKEVIGMALLDIEADAINEIMLVSDNRSGLGESGESYLVGDDFYMRSSSRFKDNSFLNVKVMTDATVKAMDKISATELITDYRGKKVLSSFDLIQTFGLNWVILAEIDFKEVMSDIVKARNKIYFICLLVFLVILPVSYLFAGKITFPILRLNFAVNQVSEGSYDQKLNCKGNDEIASLTQSFNTMIDNLKQKSLEIKEREERLQHFYDATKDAIILHYNGNITLLNHAAVKITGYKEEDLMRMNVDNFLVLKSEPPTLKSFSRSNIYETILVRKDQTLVDVEVQENAVEYCGKFYDALVIRDISKRKKAEKALLEEREKRLTSLIDGQEMERQRISRELHDSLGQSLIAIQLHIESALNADADKANEILHKTKTLFDSTIDEIRRISNNLMPAVLYEFGIQTALSNLCKRIEESAKIEVRFYTNVTGEYNDGKIKTYIYRIAQEALNNCVKHAKASLVKVYLLERTGHINFIVKDNGCGFDLDKNLQGKGNGLINMKERAQLINARFEMKSAEGQGTEINILIPFNNYEQQNQNSYR
ncbi:MAG: Oxygen sensor histidine kinase NreB [Bacteroidetes bacterium ADurb.Bin408]|nr:MAG: Oxygen sensor histidine kinase NreB [Bacteroidetes bacterium ADurb.Bin408]